MQDMWVQFPGREDPLEEEMATRSSVLRGNHMDRGTWWAATHGVAKELGTTW